MPKNIESSYAVVTQNSSYEWVIFMIKQNLFLSSRAQSAHLPLSTIIRKVRQRLVSADAFDTTHHVAIRETYFALSTAVLDNPKPLKLFSPVLENINRVLGYESHDIESIKSRKQEIHSSLEDFLSTPGKGIRIKLILEFCRAVQENSKENMLISSHDVVVITSLIEGLHNLSLIVDDCIDHDLYRRGNPTIASKHGRTGVIAASEKLLGAMESIISSNLISKSFPKDSVVQSVNSISEDLSSAVISELHWQNSRQEITWDSIRIDDIVRIYINKSAVLLSLGLELITLLAPIARGYSNELQNVLFELGIILQRVNDLENFLPLKDGLPNVDQFGDIRQRRVTFLMLRPEFSFDSDLCKIRNVALSPVASKRDQDFFVKALSEKHILRNEQLDILLSSLKLIDAIEKLKFFGNSHAVLKEMLEKYLRPIL